MKHLILNADDFAFNAAVSRGIVTLAQQGRLTATSAMTLSPRWAKDAPALAEYEGKLMWACTWIGPVRLPFKLGMGAV